jgi:quinolinate synthase
MSSVNTAIQLITREQAEKATAAGAGGTCSPSLAKGPWEYDLAETLAGVPAYGPGASSSGRCTCLHAAPGPASRGVQKSRRS